jgi:hypothetical protein
MPKLKLSKEREKAVRAAFMKIGCYPLRRIQPGHGGSIHYAGSLPFSADEMPGSTHPSGRLHGTRSVFVADGSGFTYLPAKGITLTLMANAHRTAKAAMMDKLTIAITGANGFIGSYLVDYFLTRGWQVRALMRTPRLEPRPGLSVEPFDLASPNHFPDLTGCDALIHCAYVKKQSDDHAGNINSRWHTSFI